MGNEVFTSNNPLGALGLENNGDGESNRMGLVMARAGLGKTAILVQLALDSIVRGNKVLHVSIGESVDKTRAWYDDIIALLRDEGTKIDYELLQNRMIMTFKESTFTQAILEERLDDLVQQNIYRPECLIIDGYDFTVNDHDALAELKEFMMKHGLKMLWFSVVSHRDDQRISEAGVPAPCHEVDDLFETVLLINPEEDGIKLNIIKCEACSVDEGTTLMLDPSTMLVKKG